MRVRLLQETFISGQVINARQSSRAGPRGQALALCLRPWCLPVRGWGRPQHQEAYGLIIRRPRLPRPSPSIGFHGVRKWSLMFPGSHELLVQQNRAGSPAGVPCGQRVDLMQHELSQELVPVNETEALKLARIWRTTGGTAVPGPAIFCRISARRFTSNSTLRCKSTHWCGPWSSSTSCGALIALPLRSGAIRPRPTWRA